MFSFAKKEFDLIASQKSSIGLVILYPLLIVVIIAVAFGSQDYQPKSGFERADVAYFLPADSINFNSSEFLDQLSKVERLRLHRAISPQAVKEAINLGVAKVGVVVNEPQTSFERVDIDFYYDNSTPLVSSVIMSYVNYSITLYASQKSNKALSDIWGNIDSMNSKLKTQYRKITTFEEGLDSAKQRITALESKVNSIDISSLQSKLGQFEAQYQDSKQKISLAKTDVADAKNKLSAYKQKLTATRNDLANYSSQLKTIRAQLQTIIASSIEPLRSQLQSIESSLNSTISRIDSSIAEIDSAIVDIGASQQKLSSIDSELNDASAKLDSARQTVEEFKVSVNSLATTLSELKSMISESYTYYDNTKENLAETKKMLDELTSTLGSFMSYQPETLVKPFNIYERKMYLADEKYAAAEKTATAVPLILAIVLLLTCFLFGSSSTLLERAQGINYRVYSSTTKKFSWLFGKLFGLVLFALLESAIILAVAFFAFSVPIIGSPADLLICLAAIAFSFVSVGIFLTNFTDEQSTAILASLLIIIPMIFLSGIIFPIEFMPFYVQGIAQALPLTLSNSLLIGVIVKGIPLAQMIPSITMLVFPGIILFVVSLANKRI